MSVITVTTDWDEVAKRLGAAASSRVRRRAVNRVGAAARKDILPMLAGIYSTSKAGLGAKAKAAGPGSTDPIYVLRMNRQIRLGKLKAGARKFEAKRGSRLGRLKLTQPQATGAKGVDLFRVTKGEGRGEFVLGASKGRRSRRVGGPILRRALDTNPALASRRDQILTDLAKAVAEGIEGALKGKGR